ncbi:hypothetical protein [Streptomyces cavernae]|uniref:hypothetical protein n=1 Tax=Streptomyces cavernae TaxID=2259034 RepID=UPI000FEBB4E6|nr:hypothetical protein [Streptomyces cavernae]
MTTTDPASASPHDEEPEPPRSPDRLLHWLVTGALTVGCVGYVAHEHPGVREALGAAIDWVGVLLTLVPAVRRP